MWRGDGGGGTAPIRLHLGQLPFHAGQRDAARRLKQSGYGKDMSIYALEDYTVVRHVMVKNG